jgi:hypothetical protein
MRGEISLIVDRAMHIYTSAIKIRSILKTKNRQKYVSNKRIEPHMGKNRFLMYVLITKTKKNDR